jgi:hypothetical protein
VGVRIPTSVADWRLVGRTARLVLRGPGYAVLALLAAALALTLFVVSQNLTVARFALTSSLALSNRVDILLGLYPLFGTLYGPLTSVGLLVVAALTGVNVAMLTYHVREHGLSRGAGGGSAVGVALGVLGAGCAACGSAVLAGVLSLVGATGLLTALPLEGLEFTFLALVALVLSLYWLADGMRGGQIRGCPVDLGRR